MKIMTESGDPDFEFIDALTKLLGIKEDEVGDLIEKLEVDQLTDLVDACVVGDMKAAKAIIGAEVESDGEGDSKPNVKDDHEQMAKRLFSPKDKAKAEKSKKARILRKSETELGEDTDPAVTFNIGDACAVDGEEATVKIPAAPGDTVGVMINGELKMVDKKNVHKLEEGVLGMTGMPGLKPNSELQRIRELAGMRDGDYNEPEPAEFSEPPMTPPTEIAPPVTSAPEVPEIDMSAEPMDAGLGDDLGMDTGMDAGIEPELPDMAPEEDMPELPAMDGMPSPGSALEDAAALDTAISEIEALIPNVKISEYKTLVARLKALVSMAESAGKAALTEAQLPFGIGADFKGKAKPKGFDGEMAASAKPNDLKSRMAAFATNRRNKPMDEDKVAEDKLGAKKVSPMAKKPEPMEPKPAEDGARKTLMDYVREADEGMETIGMDRNTALKAFQTRMGPSTSAQDANKAFDAMFAAGKVKQVNGAFQMPAMSDEDFHTTMSQTGKSNVPSNGTSANTAPTDAQGKGQTSGQNTANPGANVQGAPNSAYQGR